MRTYLQSKDSGLCLSLFGNNCVFWCQSAIFLSMTEAEVGWFWVQIISQLVRMRKAKKKRMMRWPLSLLPATSPSYTCLCGGQRGARGGKLTHSIWPGGDVNASFLSVSCLFIFSFHFPRSLQPTAFLHHVLPNVIPSFQPSLALLPHRPFND